ncbi:MAG: hypothetical protein A2W17_03515 [Planctomycetes bacterium RBG_16_41_13]|nr:MAG: hypothetical protein A2W17_03515 [Planctomycetes bacterium RBG_16_41_13]
MKSKNKRMNQWITIKHKLFTMFIKKDITTCEVCKGKNYVLGLSFHHFKKRRFYYARPELLGKFSQNLLVDQTCHDILEHDKKLSDLKFRELRGDEPFTDWMEL